jgi:ribosomal protein S18 acetylase RimI-like enzyme
MPDWIDGLLAESIEQYLYNWRGMAKASPAGEVFESPSVSYAISAAGVALLNLAMPKRPARSASEAAEWALEAVGEFRRFGVPGIFTAPASWLPEGAQAEIEAGGLRYIFSLMGMRTARLNDPEHPQRCEVRELDPAEATEPLARINGICYDMEESAWSHLRLPKFWESGPRAYGVFEHGEPVAVGAAATSSGVSYLMWMATLPSARGRGYAEAIIRQVWKDAQERDGAKFTVLHATQMGRPVYARLGYVAVADFPTFVWGGH